MRWSRKRIVGGRGCSMVCVCVWVCGCACAFGTASKRSKVNNIALKMATLVLPL